MRKSLGISLLLCLLVPAVVAGTPVGEDARFAPELFGGLEYHYVGPSRGGRVTTVAGHRERPGTYFMGASGGGVWRTTDYGANWSPVSDGYFATGSIGAIAVADTDPDIVYVATGSDGYRSNVIIGKGVYKSTDGGDSWAMMGLEDTGNSGALLVHPEDPDLVYVAAIGSPFAPNPERGVFRSRDGGATWEHVFFLSDKTGAVDLEFAPDDPREIYATMWEAERKPWTINSGGMEGGVFKSSDGGDNWTRLTEGLPTGLRGKADLAVSAAAPDRVWVLIEAPAEAGGVYRSDDRGATWTQVTDFQPIRNRPFYYTNITAHPTEPDTLWAMAEGFYKSVDGGESWDRVPVPHGDNHDLWVNPDDPDLMVQANDGGANVSRDGGQTWSSQLNQSTAELYTLDLTNEYPYRLYGGMQDNAIISVSSQRSAFQDNDTPPFEEMGGGTCETGPGVPLPDDPDVIMGGCKGRFIVFNRRTGQEQQYYVGFENLYGANPADLVYRFQRVAPIAMSPHDPRRVYHGSQYLHMTEDGGATWQTISPDLTAFDPETQMVSGNPITIDVTGEEHFSTLYAIAESPHEEGVIWTGSYDGPVHVTLDGGAHWKNVTPPLPGPHGRVQSIQVSPHDPAKVYVTVMRFMLGDFAPYAYKTTDYGETWTRMTTGANGVPDDFPVRVVREDPEREGLLYAGTEFGMFISFDDGDSWQSLQLNLPVTPITDMEFANKDLVISTMGRGFWILPDLTPLHELSDEIAAADAHLFAIRDAVRVYGGDGSFSPPGPAAANYPAAGASINYWLAADLEDELQLQFLDAEGAVVREFSSAGPGEEINVPEPGMREFRLERIGTPRLPTSAGMHRFIWDLRYPGPWNDDAERSGRGGPLVPRGGYQARLTTGSWSMTLPFQVHMDPRVRAEGITAADVAAQAELAREAADTLTSARLAVARLEQAREANAGELSPELQEVWDALVTAPIRYSRPKLVDQLEYLASNLTVADQAPSRDAYNRHAQLKSDLEGHLTRLMELLGDS